MKKRICVAHERIRELLKGKKIHLMESERFQLVRLLGAKLGRCSPTKLPRLREQKSPTTKLAEHSSGNPKTVKPRNPPNCLRRGGLTSLGSSGRTLPGPGACRTRRRSVAAPRRWPRSPTTGRLHGAEEAS